MTIDLVDHNEDSFRFSLELTKEEVQQLSYADMGKLLTDIKRICRTELKNDVKEETEETSSVSQKKKAHEPFVAKYYKNIVLEKEDAEALSGDESIFYERLLDHIIDNNEFELPDELQDEIEFVYKGTLQSIKYQNMFGAPEDHVDDMDLNELHQTVEMQVVREYKENLILKSIIAQENLDCTFEELEEEAIAIAERDGCSLDMVKQFMGEDYGFLKGDLLKKKAKKLICEENHVIDQ